MSSFRELINRKQSDILKPLETTSSLYSENAILQSLQKRKKKILLIGEVQSGKTRRIINLIRTSLSDFKFNFDIIIVFGGTTRNLNNQTDERFRKNNDEGLGDYCAHNINCQRQIKFKSFASIYSESEDAGKTVVYIGPKLDKPLENIYSTIKSTINLNEKKILIIDDESDYGSINTKELGDSSKYAKIIDGLFALMPQTGCAMISVTATPYANLLNKKSQQYDHIFTLPCKRNDGYTGVWYFNRLKNFYIDINDESLWYETGGLRTEEGKKLYFAFCVYIINTFMKSKIHNADTRFERDKSEMLINTDYETDAHFKIDKTISSIISESKNNLLSFTNTVNEVSSSLHKQIELKTADVANILDNIRIVVLNGQTNNENGGNYTIYIGGVKLSRGITYENLTVEYITNFPQNNISADTLLQMCRWFGYRKYLEDHLYMNVITTTKGINAIKEIEQYNSLFYDYEDTNDKGGEKVISKILNELKKLEKKSVYVKGCNDAKR